MSSTQALKAVANGERATSPVTQMSTFLDKLKPQIALALPKHLNADRMCRLALTQFSSNKALQSCSSQSIAASIVVASQMGLEIGVGGQGYLVPYKGTCTFVPGWQGLVDLLSRAGRATAWTGAVFQGDEFDYALGDSPFVRHRPGGEDDPAKMTHVYAIGRVNGSQWPVVEVWPASKILRHRDRNNKVGSSHYSFRHPEMYARKVPLLQVLKYMPKSIELSKALHVDIASDTGAPMTLDGDFVTMPNGDGSDGPADGGAELVTFAQVMDRINGAKSADDLAEAADLIGSVKDPDQREELADAYREQAKKLPA